MTEGPCANPVYRPREPLGPVRIAARGILATGPQLHGDSNAHCNKRPCRRWCGKAPEKQKPGRAAAASSDGRGSPAVAVPVDEVGPRPPTLVSIDEIWAERWVSLTEPDVSALNVSHSEGRCCYPVRQDRHSHHRESTGKGQVPAYTHQLPVQCSSGPLTPREHLTLPLGSR